MASAVPAQTLHIVQTFIDVEGEIAAEPPRSFPSAYAARAAAESLARCRVGVVGAIAWSRTADPDAGEYGEPETIVRLGTIPDWFDASGGVE